MIVLELAGVALAALLSENMVFVSCMGIGTRTRSFQDPVDALRTGYCLTAVMVLGALLSWLADFLVLERFGLQHLRLLFLALLIPQCTDRLHTLTALLAAFFSVALHLAGLHQWNVVLATMLAATMGTMLARRAQGKGAGA